MSRIRCITILLLIALSNSMVSVHAATHAQFDLSECELCAAYGDPSDAVANTGLSLPPVARQCLTSDYRDVVMTAAAIFCFQQRGPPLAF